VDYATLRERVQRLEHEHSADRDGGYGLVAGVIRDRASLGEEDRDRLDELLLSWVAELEPHLWGVSLEVLTQARAPQAGSRLLELLSGSHDLEFKDYLVRSLLRLGEDARLCREHIEESIRRERPKAIQMAALLYRLDPETALTMETEYFSRKLREAGAADEIRGYIPGMVDLLAEQSPEPVADLVRRVHARNPAAADRLVGLIREYVAKPSTERSLGAARCEAIQRALS